VKGLKSFDAERAYGFMETLVNEIGNRESATDREAKAAEKIKGWFEEFGLVNVKIQEFDVRTSRIRREEVSLPDGKKLECSAVGNSLSTPTEGVEGEVVFLDSLSQDALKTVEGKIAAVGMVLYKKDFLKVVAAKPLALIYPSRTPLAPKIYRSVRSEVVDEGNVPIVSMAHDDVLNVLKGAKRVKILSDLDNITAKSRNVTGEISGSVEGEDVLICGHYDTVRSVMGAHDNAAGVAVALELARMFAGEKIKRTLRVAAFGSEELGLRGSFEYAKKAENTKDLRLCLDYDVHGLLLGNLGATVLGSDELKMLLSFVAKELGIPLQVTSELGLGGSDHMPLAFYDVPSVMLSRSGGAAQIMHTDLEDLRWCGVEGFASVGLLSERLLGRLLMGEELPFEKKIPEQIAKALEKRFEDSGIKKETQ